MIDYTKEASEYAAHVRYMNNKDARFEDVVVHAFLAGAACAGADVEPEASWQKQLADALKKELPQFIEQGRIMDIAQAVYLINQLEQDPLSDGKPA